MNLTKLKYYIHLSWFAVWYCLSEPFRESSDLFKIVVNFKTWHYFCIFALFYSIWLKDFRYVKYWIAGVFVFYFLNEIKGGKWREEYKKKFVYKTVENKN